ncbi:hypothetical protein SteCoe_17704 [Stentor coeruleus]|uniref:Kinesin-like protein n=1 Tax=Stentor coeruleus TaxID=5963 RepID=A0A1R2BY80_9CILI|nr:hypothetical protein SteCoe_17704 [Stentor coeruleus]
MESEHLKVAIRIRPLLNIDNTRDIAVYVSEQNEVKVLDGDHYLTSNYDMVFQPESSQEQVFTFIEPALIKTLKGFNCTVFAYGQTGSGKTHTMFGGNWEENNPAPQVYYKDTQGKKTEINILKSLQGPGIIPNSITKLFADTQTKQFTFYCSFIQIYNEHLYDLLHDPRRDKSLRIRENKLYGIFVEGLAEFVTESAEDCFLLLAKGDKNRAVRQTRFNHHSSRSHTIFQMLVETDKANRRGVMKKAKLNFCDLAGSEKYDKENSMAMEHVKELKEINKSLSVLGKVIHALGSGNNSHIPYRDSKLTRLLQDSLGVNTRTILIATISPAAVYAEETISTLKFADRAKQIMVKIKKNEVSATNDQLITKLQREIQHLKTLLNLNRKGGLQELEQKIWVLTEENQKLKHMKGTFTIQEVERLKEENKKLRLELQQAGITTNNEDLFIPPREEMTPKSTKINSGSLPESRNYSKGKPLDEDGNTLKPNSGSNISKSGPFVSRMCPKCKIYPPCIHTSGYTTNDVSKSLNSAYSSLKNNKIISRSIGSAIYQTEPHISKLEEPIKMNVRYKMTNYVLENDSTSAQLKEDEARKKELQNIRARLNKITELENYRKEQFRKEIRELEENKKKEDEESRRKITEDAKKKKKLEEKKRQVEEFRIAKKINDELEQLKAVEAKREADIKRKRDNEQKKIKLIEYYNKKKE